MGGLKMILKLLIALQLYIQTVVSLQSELSMLIDAGRRECLFQNLDRNLNIEADYQVISGGDLDVSFWVSSPTNRIIYTELRKQGGQINFRTDEVGEYRFCFDNSFSRFAYKQVFFFFTTNDQFIDPQFPAASSSQMPAQLDKDQLGELDEKLENFKSTFTKVVQNLERAQRIQNLFKAYEIIDRNLMENNYERVNFWSTVNICLMIGVGVIQVVMIRSLFEDKSKIGRILRGTGSGPIIGGTKRPMT